MRTVEGRVRIGVDEGDRGSFPSLEAFLEVLESVATDHDVTVQAFDARYVAGKRHLRAAVEHAERAMARGTNVADELAVEILCYAAGRRQIDQAMEMGLSAGESHVIVVACGTGGAAATEAIGEHLEPTAVEPDEETLIRFFDITERERRATDADLETLVLERVALLDVEK